MQKILINIIEIFCYNHCVKFDDISQQQGQQKCESDNLFSSKRNTKMHNVKIFSSILCRNTIITNLLRFIGEIPKNNQPVKTLISNIILKLKLGNFNKLKKYLSVSFWHFFSSSNSNSSKLILLRSTIDLNILF